jgi:predicted PurR-regulated permease PerM
MSLLSTMDLRITARPRGAERNRSNGRCEKVNGQFGYVNGREARRRGSWPAACNKFVAMERQETTLLVPWRTIFKLLAAAALVWAWLQVWQLLLLLITSVVIAVTLEPIVEWLDRKLLPRWAAAMVVGAGSLGALLALIWITSTALVEQTQFLGDRLHVLQRTLVEHTPSWLIEIAFGSRRAASATPTIEGAPWYLLALMQTMLTGLAAVVLAFVLAIYLLVEGEITYAWLLAYVPPSRRHRVHDTILEARTLMLHYVVGNVATSVFAGVSVYTALVLLHVPVPFLLALLAAICDFIPVLGFVLSALPAVLIAVTVSGSTAVIVAAFYVLDHAVENYLIAPRVYGSRLRLSNIAVIVALFAGAAIGGVVGALVALPFAAAYPAIERIWLEDYLGRRVVQDHERLMQQGEEADQTSARVTENP